MSLISLSFPPPFLSPLNVTGRCKHAVSLVMISFNHVPSLSSFSSDCRSHLQNKEWTWTWMFCWQQEVFLQAGWKTLPRLMLILISMSTTISVLWGGYLLFVNSKFILLYISVTLYIELIALWCSSNWMGLVETFPLLHWYPTCCLFLLALSELPHCKCCLITRLVSELKRQNFNESKRSVSPFGYLSAD